MCGAVIQADGVEHQIFPLFSSLAELEDTAFALVLRTAINWHSQGYALEARLGRYLAYWASVELLGTFLYDHLPVEMTGTRSKTERQTALLKLLREPLSDESASSRMEELNEIWRPTVRTKVLILSHWTGDRAALERTLFAKVEGHSLYSIRNDIAHGNVGEHHHAFAEVVRRRIDDMKMISRSIILTVLRNVQSIVPLLPF